MAKMLSDKGGKYKSEFTKKLLSGSRERLAETAKVVEKCINGKDKRGEPQGVEKDRWESMENT
jgi:hypothetical protein